MCDLMEDVVNLVYEGKALTIPEIQIWCEKFLAKRDFAIANRTGVKKYYNADTSINKPVLLKDIQKCYDDIKRDLQRQRKDIALGSFEDNKALYAKVMKAMGIKAKQ